MKNVCRITLLLVLLLPFQLFSQTNPAKKGVVERIKVHGKSLEGNLEGDSPDRHVSVYLPASYKSNPQRRYPVVYFLHGFTDNDAQWYGLEKHWINLPRILDSVFASGSAREMIVVTPDAYTRYGGSMYSNSITTGNWEAFVARELVSYIDRHYRTLAQKESRGLAGHSMGGYGTLRIGQKYPEVFSSLYLLSPCCLDQNGDPSRSRPDLDTVKTVEDFQKVRSFMTKASFASAAAWSPDPTNAPLYVQLPNRDESWNKMVLNKWIANSPLIALDQYITNIKKLKSLSFDAGDKDASIAASIKTLDKELNNYAIQHGFEIYEGDHLNRIAERIAQKMLPLFSTNLRFDTNTGKK